MSAPLRLDWSEEAFLKFNFSKVLAKRPITSTCAKQADPKHLGDFSAQGDAGGREAGQTGVRPIDQRVHRYL